MSLDRLTNILVTITLIEMMVAIGMGATFAQIGQTMQDWWTIARAGVANYVVVPTATVALLILFAVDPPVAAGILVLAACPGAPFGPPFAVIAQANAPLAVGLMVILAGSSAIGSPILLHLMMPGVSRVLAPAIDVVGTVSSLMI